MSRAAEHAAVGAAHRHRRDGFAGGAFDEDHAFAVCVRFVPVAPVRHREQHRLQFEAFLRQHVFEAPCFDRAFLENALARRAD